MKKQISIIFLNLIAILTINAQQADWENNHILSINREPARDAFIPYGNLPGDRTISLNGTWKFRWTPTPAGKINDFFTTDFIDREWKTLAVPANWEVNGYGTPIYISSGYSFKIDPPRVMGTPKETYTTFKERNPTGQYRRTFILPVGWKSEGQTFLRFDGVISAYYVWINGVKVGYSQGSMEPAEFNVTSFLRDGENQIAVEVYKYCDGSYIEDQDMWRFAGIHRNVSLFHTQDVRITDLTVRTILDKEYRNASLEIDPKLSVYGKENGKGYIVRAKIENLINITADAASILNLDHKAALMNEWNPQRGPRKTGRLKALIVNPAKWTAETPNLYTLLITLEDSTGKVVERIRQPIGFRSIEISGRQMLINGKPIKLRGVNRHEHDPRLGKVMTEKRMLQDILLMKQANINAVRTCHYPNVSRWYELCDSIGIYVLDETDLEEHGLRGTLASDPDWCAAFMDRVIRLGERDKNHPSVVIWSLGNEAGYGPNFAAMSGWLHDFDPTRPVHYEGAQGINGNPDPSTVDLISRFYPRVQDDYLNPGVTGGSDAERPENARWERLVNIAPNDTRPVLASEYAHAMGNAIGNLQEYWDEIYSHRQLLGGFIWEWADEGIFKTLPNGKTEVAYGGDFGDFPNLKTFCIKGIVTSDREITPKYLDVKKVYQPVAISLKNNSLLIINRNQHTSLSQYRCVWSCTVDGKEIKKGEMVLPETPAGDSVTVPSPMSVEKLPKGDVCLKISFLLNRNCVWAKAGYEVAFEQFCLHEGAFPTATVSNKGALSIHESNKELNATGNRFSVSWDAKDGSLTSLVYDGHETLAHPADFSTQPMIQAFRAPVDNDRSFGNWLAKDWIDNNLNSPVVSTDSILHSIRKDGALIVVVSKTNRYKSGKIKARLIYTVTSDGTVEMECHFIPVGDLPELPRLGIALAITPEYTDFSWYGRGPQENYPDRKDAALVGNWKGKVSEQAERYPRPQETGNKEEIRTLSLTNNRGRGLKVEALDKTISGSALNFTANDLNSTDHDCNLIPRNDIILSLDCAIMGLGNSSCGPGVLKKYAIEKKEHVLHIRLNRVK